MKKIYLLFFALVCSVGFASAARPTPAVDVKSASIVRNGDRAEVAFDVVVPRGAVKSGYTMALVPVITDGTYKVSLPAIIVKGRGADRTQMRHEWVAGTQIDYANAYQMRPGEGMSYSAHVDVQPWMEGAALTVESLTWGCCTRESKLIVLAENVLYGGPEYIEEPKAYVPETTGDMMAETFHFVIPESQYNPGEPIYDDDRENALIVYYRQGNSTIQPEYGQNRLILTNLIAAVDAIASSRDSKVSRIVIAGFASPEGTFSLNDRLAWERAVAVKNYIARNTSLREELITLHNGSEDWRGLRSMVENSSLTDKAQILRIIDDVPVVSADGRTKPRLQQLQQLNGGVSYQYMYDHFFPRLRNGAFIRVYYRNN